MMGNPNPTMNNMNGMMGNPMIFNMMGTMCSPNPMMNCMNNQVMMNQMPMQAMAMNLMNSMGNMNPQMQDQNQVINNNPQNNEITLLFDKPNELEKLIGIQCQQNDKMGDVFNRYQSKIGVKDPPESKFISNAKTINPELTVAECGLMHNHQIHVIITKGILAA